MRPIEEGDIVAVHEDYEELGLRSGDTGIVCCLYAMTPPAYEVRFRDRDGEEFDMLCYESEIYLASDSQSSKWHAANPAYTEGN